MISDVEAESTDTWMTSRARYSRALQVLYGARVPFLVGGAYAFEHYVGINRATKDFDIFVERRHCAQILAVLAEAGYWTELTYPHWLGKARCEEACIDVIFSSGNGTAIVDAEWFAHAEAAEILGQHVFLCPPEEMLWSKAYVMERERYDGADVLHLLLARGAQLDWQRLLRRFDAHWRVLLSYLILFGFVYPSAQEKVPAWLMQELCGRLQSNSPSPSPIPPICYGTLLSRAQYLPDVTRCGYQDARLAPDQVPLRIVEIPLVPPAAEE